MTRAHDLAEFLFLAVLFSWCAPPVVEASLADEHATMQGWRFATDALQVEDVTWKVDSATWRLESGSIRYIQPTAGGAVTGFVFDGSGRFELEIPDPFEVEQLRRFSGDPSLDGVQEGFSRMVYRFSGSLPANLPLPPTGGDYRVDATAKDRHEKWLYQDRLDADARVLAGQYIAGDTYLLADMETESFGWLMFEFEPLRDEEINLTKLRKLNEFVEVWVSMDRAEHREEDGRPGWASSEVVDLVHIDVDVDLRDHKGSKVMRGRPVEEDWAHFRSTVTIEALDDGVAAVQFFLHPWARITGVSSTDGHDVEVVRDHIGKRFVSVPNDVWDGTVTLFLDNVLARGERQSVTLEYDYEILNYVSGDSWYPTVEHAVIDLHTAKMAFWLPRDIDVWAVGERVDEPDPRGPSWEVWEVTDPTMMVAFTFGKGFKEERIVVDGLPEVVILGDPSGFGGEKKLRNVGADMINSLNFFKQYFGFELDDEQIYATSITAGHGQAFIGFLHLAQYTFNSEHPGASELFRAHEVAHQMWGHTVRWRSYRDQWLSEAFAEYSAMLYVQAAMPNKPYFEEILEVYTAEQLGSFKGSMSKFARPWDVNRVRVEGDELGPIAAGYRASTARIPSGGTIQLYRKGPLVLHMINMILQAVSPKGDDLFREVMHEFLVAYSGEEASTEDFKEVLEEVSGKDWDPLFDAWIYGCGTPTFEWSYDIEKGPEGVVLAVHVVQKDVPDDFRAVVPIRITLPGNRTGTNLLPLDAPEQTLRINLPTKPTKVIFNPDHAVPARVKKVK